MKNKRELNTVLYISISYGNYIGGAGGTDKVILSEQIELNKKGISLLFCWHAGWWQPLY